MSIPQSKSMSETTSSNELISGISGATAGEVLARSHKVDADVKADEIVNEVVCFNDYVAVLLVPRKSTITLPTGGNYDTVGVIVGFGPTCNNPFELGQKVTINPKGGAIVAVTEQGPEYDDKVVHMYQERNIYHVAKRGLNVNVVKSK